MGGSVVVLEICCALGGVTAPWLLPMISTTVPLSLETAHTTVSQPMITLLLFIIIAMFKGNLCRHALAVRLGVCGYDHEQSMVSDHRPRFRHAGERSLCSSA